VNATRQDVIAAAKIVAQDDGDILNGPNDYETAMDLALRIFDLDRPNLRVVHHTVTASAFRFVLLGTGALAGMTGLDAWIDGRSRLARVWHPYDTTVQGQEPIPSDEYRIIREPGPTVVLEFLYYTPSAQTLRLEFVRPHVLDQGSAASSSVLASDLEALAALVGVHILEMAAARAAKNTGSSSLPTDVVDRRTMGSEFQARARNLRDRYNALVGKRLGDDVAPAVGVFDLDVQANNPRGFLTHSRRMH